VIPELPRTRNRARALTALPFAVLALTALGGCSASVSTSKDIDTDEAEKQIAASLTKSAGSKVTASCPDDVKGEKGATFTCKVKSADGESATVLVTQKDDKGNISWEVQQ